MRATVDAKTFAQALDQVSGLIHKSVIPVLNAVLVRFEEDRCTLASTNLNTWLSVGMPAQGDSFAFLLDRPRESARAFRQFEGELAMEQTETGEGDRRRIKLALSCGPRSAELHPFLPDDFPEQQAWEPMHSFTANAAKLYARVERVKYAVGIPRKEEARACRISVQFSGNRVYTLDGCRMAWDTDPELEVPAPFMAAPDALEHLKLFGDQTVSVQLGERFARVTDGMTSLVFRLPEGELYKLDSALTDKFRAEFQVSPKGFLAELKYLKQSLRGNRAHLVRFSGGALLAESMGGAVRHENLCRRVRRRGIWVQPGLYDGRHGAVQKRAVRGHEGQHRLPWPHHHRGPGARRPGPGHARPAGRSQQGGIGGNNGFQGI